MAQVLHSLSGHVGTAGWSIPSRYREFFPDQGSHLERYGQRLNAVEINSSFYRDHKSSTYARWAAAVSPSFRFSVKLSRRFTHEQRLKVKRSELVSNLQAIEGLGRKWGVLLAQLPPSLAFHAKHAREFLTALHDHTDAEIVVEPRHASWSSSEAKAVIEAGKASLVIADPDRCGLDELVGPTAYFRLHGAPEIYKSAYSPEALRKWIVDMLLAKESGREVWCIFDNTARGFATQDAFAITASI